ncbi:MAG: hypothetical protein HY690_03620 [Chloroflexi bacterium]|nr:hypothetical protein [Chloroflexota bacterium]
MRLRAYPLNQAQAADCVRLLKLACRAAQAADPSITVVTSGLSLTGWNDDTACAPSRYARQSWAPWSGVMMLWTLPDPSRSVDREEAWWAIADPSGAPRPAYNALLQARYNGTLP